MDLQFKNLSLNIISRPRTSSYMVELSLGALLLYDKLTPGTLFPVLVGPPGQERLNQLAKGKSCLPRTNTSNKLGDSGQDCLFYLVYDCRPENCASGYRYGLFLFVFCNSLICDNFRLQIRSKSLDVVYHPSAVKWLIEFLCSPHHRTITQMHIEAMKMRTKKEIFKNWEQILDGRVVCLLLFKLISRN